MFLYNSDASHSLRQGSRFVGSLDIYIIPTNAKTADNGDFYAQDRFCVKTTRRLSTCDAPISHRFSHPDARFSTYVHSPDVQDRFCVFFEFFIYRPSIARKTHLPAQHHTHKKSIRPRLLKTAGVCFIQMSYARM